MGTAYAENIPTKILLAKQYITTNIQLMETKDTGKYGNILKENDCLFENIS